MVPTQKMPGAIKHWGSEGPATGDDYISWNLYLTFVLNPNLRNMDYSHILTHLQTNISLKHILYYCIEGIVELQGIPIVTVL